MNHLNLFCTAARTASSAGAMKRSTLLAFAVVCVVWGSTYLGIRVALEGFPPFLLGALRFLVAGAALYAVARCEGASRAHARVEWALGLRHGVALLRRGQRPGQRGRAVGVVGSRVRARRDDAAVGDALRAPSRRTRDRRGSSAASCWGSSGVVVLNLGGELRASPGGRAVRAARADGLGARFGGEPAAAAAQGDDAHRGADARRRRGDGRGQRRARRAHGRRAVARARRRRSPTSCVFGSLVGFSAYSLPAREHAPGGGDQLRVREPRHRRRPRRRFSRASASGATSVVGAAIVLAAVVLVLRRARHGRRLRASTSASRSRSIVAVASCSDSKRSTTPDSPTTT